MYAPTSQYLPSVDAYKRFVTAGNEVTWHRRCCPTSKLQSINIRSMIPELSRVSDQGLVSGLGLGLLEWEENHHNSRIEGLYIH